MSLKASEFDRLISKLGFETRQTHHLLAWLVVEGKVAVRTRRSNRSGDLPASHIIRQQLKLNDRELNAAIRCTLGRDGYLEILRKRDVI